MTAAERMKQYEDLFAQSQAYNPAKFTQDFEKAYGEATNYNKDLYDERAGAIGQAQALPNQLREQYYSSAIRNPLAQESLISTRRGNLTSDITALTDFLGARGARYQDVLGKHLAGYQTSAEQARTAAENAWRMYQDSVQQDQFNRQLNRGTGGGGGPSSFEQMLMDYINGQNTTPQIQKSPMNTAQQKTLAAIQSLAQARKQGGLSKPIDYYVNNIVNQARTKFGLNLNPQAVWQQVGNDEGPQSLSLFR